MLVFFNLTWAWVSHAIDSLETRKLCRTSPNKLASEESEVAGALVGHDEYKGTGWTLTHSVNMVGSITFRTRNAALHRKGTVVIIYRLGNVR